MNNKSYVVTPTYRLLIALLLSLLIHSALLTVMVPMPLGHSTHNDILHIRLNTTPAIPAPATSRPDSAASPAPDQPRQKILPLTQTTTPSLTVSPSVGAIPDKPDTANLVNTTPASHPAAPSELNQQPVPRLPDHTGPAGWVEIEFEIFAGENRTPLGKAIQHYESDASGRYLLNFKSEDMETHPTGSNPIWEIEIEGNITAYGLRPSTFVRKGNLAQSLMALNGNNSDLTAPEDQHKGRMPDGILDRISMLYQFMHIPPNDNDDKLWLTDGNKLGAYSYHVVGMEPVEMRSQGVVNATHIIFSANETSETIDLWLAPDFRYLPVKVRHKDSRGEITEQVASSVSIK